MGAVADRHGQSWYQAALTLVERRHEGAEDKLCRPYVQHFIRVADRLVTLFPEATPAQVQAALLHDALEEGGSTPDDLRREGIGEEAISLIERITLPKDGRSYAQYVEDLVATGDIAAIQVKLADNLDAIELFGAIGDRASLDLVETRYKPTRRRFEETLAHNAASPKGFE